MPFNVRQPFPLNNSRRTNPAEKKVPDPGLQNPSKTKGGGEREGLGGRRGRGRGRFCKKEASPVNKCVGMANDDRAHPEVS